MIRSVALASLLMCALTVSADAAQGLSYAQCRARVMQSPGTWAARTAAWLACSRVKPPSCAAWRTAVNSTEDIERMRLDDLQQMDNVRTRFDRSPVRFTIACALGDPATALIRTTAVKFKVDRAGQSGHKVSQIKQAANGETSDAELVDRLARR